MREEGTDGCGGLAYVLGCHLTMYVNFKYALGAENPSLELCAQLVEKYEPTDEGKAQVREETIQLHT